MVITASRTMASSSTTRTRTAATLLGVRHDLGQGRTGDSRLDEDLADLLGEGRRGERLLQECVLGLQDAVADDGVVGVPRQEQYLQPRLYRGQPLGQLPAAQ